MNQTEVFQFIQKLISEIQKNKTLPIRVAINGIEGAGKTTFAESLVTYLRSQDLDAMHVTIDGFHFNKERRYAQGRDSARGYYEDSYDEKAFVKKVLEQSQQANPSYIPAIHDLKSDKYLDMAPVPISSSSILVVDGAYLFKPIYLPHFDLKVYLTTSFEIAANRGAMREADALGGIDKAKQKFKDRYHAASKMYLEEVNPIQLADFVIDSTNFDDLKIVYSSIIVN